MAVTTAKIRAREKERGKKAYTAIDNAGNLHYAFDKATLGSIITKANNAYNEKQSAKAFRLYDVQSSRAYDQAVSMANFNNQFNAEQVQKQMDFQKMMSDTAHQREVKDLVAAGLNPILSANGGASTPSGSSASADTSATTLKAQMAMQQMQIGAQLKMQEQNIASSQKIARWNNDLQRELGYAQLKNNEAIANINAGASMYGAQLSSSASRYGAELSSSASKYAVDNPNTLQGQLFKILSGKSENAKTAGSLIGKLTTLFSKYGKSKPKPSVW